jgi:deazaflavin-dependent oxidoreductase (nitroreductase family)
MWFMNKIANPFVRLILRSPLHSLLSASLLLITYRGRKSGREYTLPVQYVRKGQAITIIPGNPAQKIWWRNLVGGVSVKLTLRGQSLSGQATVLQGEDYAELITSGLRAYLEKFPSAAGMYRVSRKADGSYDTDELKLAALSMVMVRVELGN